MIIFRQFVFPFLLILLFSLEIIYGPVRIPFADVMRILWSGDGDPIWRTIITESRLPRALTAALAGCGLALSGLLMQTLFRNPLAGPSVLGISSGASLGVALLVLGTLGTTAMSGLSGYVLLVSAAMAGAFMVMMVIVAVAGRIADNTSLLIFGIMLSYFTGAVVDGLQNKASNEALRSYITWGMGSFAEADYGAIGILTVSTITGIVLAIFILNKLNLLLLGNDYARSMGINVRSTRLVIIIATGMLTGVITAFCGPIAFIGLAVPHLVRTFMKSSNHPILFFPVLFAGAAMGMLCDLVSRMLNLPLNTISSALGAPVVIYIIFRGSKSAAII